VNNCKFWILAYQESFAAGYSLYLKIDDKDYYIREISRDNLKEYKEIEIIPHSDDLKINYDQFNGYAELNERLLLELNDSFKKNEKQNKAIAEARVLIMYFLFLESSGADLSSREKAMAWLENNR